MQKPFANRPGNGMHRSIGDGESKLFSDKSDVRGLDGVDRKLNPDAPRKTNLCK